MQHFKKPLILTGWIILLVLVLGIGASTWIYQSDISSRKKTERAEMVGQAGGVVVLMVAFPVWILAAGRWRKEKDEILASEQHEN